MAVLAGFQCTSLLLIIGFSFSAAWLVVGVHEYNPNLEIRTLSSSTLLDCQNRTLRRVI